MKLRSQALTSHASALHLSLLLSLGLTPLVACGGSAVSSGEGDEAGASGAGATNAGSTSRAGASVGGASVGGTSNAGASSGGAGGMRAFCDRPVTNPISGLVSCQNGFSHRPQARTCTLPPDVGAAGSTGEAGSPGEAPPPTGCTNDAQCASLPLGYCDLSYGGMGAVCRSGCLQDSDCADSAVCICDGSASGGKCVYSNCATDSDCGPTAYCATASGVCGGYSFKCTTNEDECLGSSECPNGVCYDVVEHRSCHPDAVCGRPFLIADEARVADLTARRDWLDLLLTPDLSGLSPLQRAELGAHWARLGQLEHASIAAFARFNLQLLSLGAPADLVEACNQALVDETAHAKVCFAFASAYAGTPLGPSKLDMSHCFDETSLLSVTKLVIVEGCVGETVAALEALEEADKATDPTVKNALLRIAADERNHAELAYRFVRWALAECSAEERAELVRAAEQCVRRFETGAVREEQRAAARLVVRPLLEQLA
jgi:hypothetical protein